MEIGPLLVAVGLAVVTVAFIARPLVAGGADEPAEAERRLSTLRAEQDQVLSLLQELEMDFAMGKIEPEVYQAERAARLRRGGELLREIDTLVGETPAGPPAGATPELEARIAALRKQAAGFCGHCGSPLARDDRFCTRCGQAAPGAEA